MQISEKREEQQAGCCGWGDGIYCVLHVLWGRVLMNKTASFVQPGLVNTRLTSPGYLQDSESTRVG